MADYFIESESLVAIADAIRTTIGGDGIIYPEDMPDRIRDGSGNTRAFVERTVTEMMHNNIDAIGDYAFYNNSTIETISFPNCTTVGAAAFDGCTNIKNVTLGTETVYSFALAKSTLTSLSFSNGINIGSSYFKNCTNLKTAFFPNCTTIGQNAFDGCTNLISANFPNCTTLGANAFSGCKNLREVALDINIALTSANNPVKSALSALKEVHFTNCTSIGNLTFGISSPESSSSICPKLQVADFPACTTVSTNAFDCCVKLSDINFPACATIGVRAFAHCYKLETAHFPLCTTINTGAFLGCSALTSVSFPVCKEVGEQAFTNCVNLVYIDLPMCTSIGKKAFYDCNSLETLILRNSEVVTLHEQAFEAASPNIYVPSSLLSAYLEDGSWETFSDTIFPIEEIE